MEAENQQLKEYSNYLDENEDELRHFKHDYENLLNSLKISAEKGDSKSVVKQLAKYTNSQFDEEKRGYEPLVASCLADEEDREFRIIINHRLFEF
jgi:hypothetical protein